MLSAHNCTISFSSDHREVDWRIVNDGVMGGLSEGDATYVEDKLVFSGDLSLRNNGGFSWLQGDVRPVVDDNVRVIRMMVKTDDHTYQLTARSGQDPRFHFESEGFSTGGKWEEVTFALKEMQMTWRGRTFDQFFSDEELIEVGLILKDGKEGAFRVEIQCIHLD